MEVEDTDLAWPEQVREMISMLNSLKVTLVGLEVEARQVFVEEENIEEQLTSSECFLSLVELTHSAEGNDIEHAELEIETLHSEINQARDLICEIWDLI